MAAKLYQFLGSPFCAKVRKLLAFKGVEFEVVEVDYLERKELLLASGQITVPAVTLDSGETIVDSARIATRLEELYPEPTIFPAGWRGMHLVLADYIDNQLEDSIYRVALADELAYYSRQGADRAALWRLIRERKYGAGFVDRVVADHAANWERARAALSAVRGAARQRAVSDRENRAGGFRAIWAVVLPGVHGRVENSGRHEKSARVFRARRSDHFDGRGIERLDGQTISPIAVVRKWLKSAPVESSATSYSDAVRPGTNTWWPSSVSAYTTQSISASHGRCAIGPRTSSQKSMPYSVKCAALRTSMWHTSTEAAVIPGISQRSIGSITLLVLAAEKAEVESVKINPPHKMTGIHSPSGASCGGSADRAFAGGISWPPFSHQLCRRKSRNNFGWSAFS